jgi:hypothetical protein
VRGDPLDQECTIASASLRILSSALTLPSASCNSSISSDRDPGEIVHEIRRVLDIGRDPGSELSE